MSDPRDGPAEAVAANWERVQDDVDSLATEYEAAGWTVHTIHPGEVTPRRDDGVAPAVVDVLVPDNELGAVKDLVAGDGFDAVDVYRETADGTVFLVVVVQSVAEETVVIYPLYYQVPAADVLVEEAHAEDVFRVRFRNLADDDAVLLEHPDPDPFLPE